MTFIGLTLLAMSCAVLLFVFDGGINAILAMPPFLIYYVFLMVAWLGAYGVINYALGCPSARQYCSAKQ
jgi:hypothetical protein